MMKWHLHYFVLILLTSKCLPSSAIESEPKVIEMINQLVVGAIGSLSHILGLNHLPIDEEVTIWCASKDNLAFTRVSKDNNKLRSAMDSTKPIAFLIHGWLSSYQANWVRALADNYINYTASNICAVDWNRLALMEYSLSASHTASVGNYLGSFIQHSISAGHFAIDNVTLVGHSMGAHIAGFTGSFLRGEVPLLIGLDPAGPGFTKYPEQPENQRLDPSDARHVQVIHTDQYFIGSNMNLGHVDFYPNGGVSPQQGCQVTVLDEGVSFLNFICSHEKAIELFTTSLNPASTMEGTQCSSYSDYLAGLCAANPKEKIGIYTSKALNGTFYT